MTVGILLDPKALSCCKGKWKKRNISPLFKLIEVKTVETAETTIADIILRFFFGL